MKARLRYGFADRNRGRWPVKDICRVLQVSISGYYRWVRRKDRPTRDELLSGAIKEVLDEHLWNDNYGVRRMQQLRGAEDAVGAVSAWDPSGNPEDNTSHAGERLAA